MKKKLLEPEHIRLAHALCREALEVKGRRQIPTKTLVRIFDGIKRKRIDPCEAAWALTIYMDAWYSLQLSIPQVTDSWATMEVESNGVQALAVVLLGMAGWHSSIPYSLKREMLRET